MYVCMCACMYVCMYLCIHVCHRWRFQRVNTNSVWSCFILKFSFYKRSYRLLKTFLFDQAWVGSASE